MPRSPVARISFAAFMAIVIGVVVALAVAASTSDDDTSDASDRGGTDGGWHGAVLAEPTERPDFTLTDTSGEPFDFREETAGELTLLFFGYTNCPDICPLTMATLTTALEQEGMPEPTVVFVSTDPERDTPEKLRTWLDAFDPDYVGLTGTAEQVHAAEEATGLQGSFLVDAEGQPIDDGHDGHEGQDGDGYEVAHSSQVVAFTGDDLSHITYPFGIERGGWAADLPRLAAGELPDPTT
jgi:protein SCO1/2